MVLNLHYQKNYGQINVSSPTNLPPHRYNSATWNDQLETYISSEVIYIMMFGE